VIIFCHYGNNDDWTDALNASKGHAESSSSLSKSDRVDGGHSALVSWLPINALLGQKAYADIAAFNDLCMTRDIRLILNSYFDSDASVSNPKKKRSCSPDVSTRRYKRARIP